MLAVLARRHCAMGDNMLLKHSLIYILGRGLPAAINFISLIIFTRVLTPQEYGIYTVVLAYVGLVDSVLFRWQRFGLLRFRDYSDHQEQRNLLATIIRTFIAICVVIGAVAVVVYQVVPNKIRGEIWLIGVLLVCATGLYELIIELVRAELQPLTYGALSITRAVLTLIASVALAVAGLGAAGVLLGTLIGYVVPVIRRLRRVRDEITDGAFDGNLGKVLFLYGLPLSVTFALNFVISTSDRLIITWMLGEDASGLYAAAYNIPAQSIGVAVTIVGLAGLPLVFRSLESGGVQAAKRVMKEYLTILLAVSLPAASGLVILSGDVSRVLLGTSYQIAAEEIIPVVAVSCLTYGLITQYLSLSFQVATQTRATMWSAAAGAALNVVLNILWLPKYGLVGAAYATFWSYVAYFVVGAIFASRILPIPWWTDDLYGVFAGTAGMILALKQLGGAHSIADLAFKVVVGMSVYCGILLLLNTAGIRSRLLQTAIPLFSHRRGR